jgi:hypothetical protein
MMSRSPLSAAHDAHWNSVVRRRMTDRKFHEVPIVAGDALAGGFFDYGLRGTQPTQLKSSQRSTRVRQERSRRTHASSEALPSDLGSCGGL